MPPAPAPIQASLDHLVVTVPRLADGVRAIEQQLGCALGPGGAHPRMGTHNALLRLDGGAYLEVIAIDPDAPAPGRPRWFGLDTLAADAPARLRAWVARVPPGTVDAAAAACPDAPGAVEPMRRGDLHWRITVPADGRPPLDGLAPALIEWPADARHPAQRLPPSPVVLDALRLHHPDPEAARRWLRALGLDAPGCRVDVDPAAATVPHLTARLRVQGREVLLGP